MGAQDTDTPVSRRKPWRAAALVGAFVAVYVVVLFGYAAGDRGDAPDDRAPDDSGALVYLDVVAVDGENFSIDARVSVYPGTELVDDSGFLSDDLVVDVSPLAAGGRLEFDRGTRPSAQPISLYADGDITRWPFDVHESTDVTVRVVDGSSPVPSTVAVTDSLTGWTISSSVDATAQSLGITAERTGASWIFALALCGVLLVLPVCALFVSIQTLRSRRKFQPPMVTWFAVMLFAVLPLRNLFPGSPPIGSWVDYALVVWVVAGLATAMALYVLTWWRQAP
ncbi:DUF4436 family protein [Rhodococcoides kyotonense]|uniref:DUF4436 domain-containing protein n=1 Tax=Rhodococcoides kyotonense TaxID=398843 RepID=A0A239JSR5_9NOCA|nr:DUF4436 family protein [Rhodococcus kyotonensis]SNT09006.1 protein of unknown function [Rhodococcus kyotonensis]